MAMTQKRAEPASCSCRSIKIVAAALASAALLSLLLLPPTILLPHSRMANPLPLPRSHSKVGGHLSSLFTFGRGSYANSNGAQRLQQLMPLPSPPHIGSNDGGGVDLTHGRNLSTEFLADAPAAQRPVAPSCRDGDRRTCVTEATPAAENSSRHLYVTLRSSLAARNEERTATFALPSSASEGGGAAAAAEADVKANMSNGGHSSTATGALTVTAAMATATTTTKSGGSPTVYIGMEKFSARLGNRMFQYASGLALALRYGRPAVLVLPDSSGASSLDIMRRVFRLSPLPTLFSRPPPSAAVKLSESSWGRYDARRFDNASTFERSVYTAGYFQSWKYFAPVADRMRREFALTADADLATDSYFRSVGLPLPSEGSGGGDGGGGRVDEALPVRVGVHVRRGDMLGASRSYGVAPAEYLLKAIAHYRDKYAAPRYNISFIFATDDHAWVRDLVASRLPPELIVRYVSLDAGGDMAVLSRCDHSIITSGTFGWWSAWLAGGDVVYYRDFIKPTSPLYATYSPDDYYPPEWLGLSS